MRNTVDMARQLITMGKRGHCVNHQENRLLIDAGEALQILQSQKDALMTENADLRERINWLEEEKALLEERVAIMAEDGDEEDPFRDAAAPGEAAEDFWDDDWPLS